jgi:thymidylate synthase (FAD)
MGNDDSIAETARCCYGKNAKRVNDNRGLVRRLIRDKHQSPLEFCEIILHLSMPIFVARQWVRHRTASMNEASGRYSVIPMVFYTPEEDRHQRQNKTNKQGCESGIIDNIDWLRISSKRNSLRKECVSQYNKCLETDLSRELCRIDLPLSTYTYMYWKMDLHNLLHFLRLRLDEHAQWEIRQYANVIAAIVKEWLPVVWEAFLDYNIGSVSFSRQEQALLLQIINKNSDISDQNYIGLGMTKAEREDFTDKINKLGLQYDEKDIDLYKIAKDASFYEEVNK